MVVEFGRGKIMMKWLSERKAEYIEPLVEGDEDKLKYLFEGILPYS